MSDWMFRSTSREKDNVEVILIQSDHLPLQHLDQMKNANSRLMRWAMQLQPYAFVFKQCLQKRTYVRFLRTEFEKDAEKKN